MEGIARVTPQEAHDKVQAGRAILVCAYESDNRFAQFHLEGAIPFSQFKTLFPTMAMDQEVIFYCNCAADRSAEAQAANHLTQGYPNMKALGGGVDAWKTAGFQLL